MDNETLLAIYKIILDYLDVGVHAVDKDGKTVIYNKKMMEIEGMDIEDVLDKNILDVFQFFQDEESTLMKILKSGESILNYKQKYFNNKGMEINTVHNSYPLTNEGGTIGAVEIVRDVTKLERILDSSKFIKSESDAYTFEQVEANKWFPQDVLVVAKQASTMSSPLLVIGEHGTFKNIIAQCIHYNSALEGNFYSQNCAELSDVYMEKLLFGDKDQAGILEIADGGTLLLEEIHFLPIEIQTRLLSSLKNKKVMRLGERVERPTNVRIIGSISDDPINAIGEGKFLKELFYFFSQSSIVIPPLRDRKKDIPEMVKVLIKKYNERFQMNVRSVSKEVLYELKEYDWPGNMKELEHIIENTMKLMRDEDFIDSHHLPANFNHKTAEENEFLFHKDKEIKPLEDYLQEAEIYYIQKALQFHDYNITKTANSLQMSRQNLQYRLRKHGIAKK
ncbi:sigma 54-interacting transcriptional regulator [Bacillus sp. FJAT-49736]|uniref:sigma 54-interacting transcriptional regulator n=1 Tax=Bacillus sp. FJAT-49736 TaxID=2833582 RepID=UPI001BCA5101|nr:sigma 54-interacting transcriptional regulator [Bacillus sp. FJAT-49736]MBS4173921.1 sigma 54-interacting transcriptional regulator [Bacillus sp. FJAT-49736]